jgi:SecD/SecF fusion protein
LTDTSAGTDRRGKPCVNFRFNAEGAAKFAALTGNHLPEQGGQFTRKLGILLDDELDSAPSIQSTISDRGEITGDFTKDEIQDLVATLNAGSLPFRLILVHQMTVGPTNPGP